MKTHVAAVSAVMMTVTFITLLAFSTSMSQIVWVVAADVSNRLEHHNLYIPIACGVWVIISVIIYTFSHVAVKRIVNHGGKPTR
jgi:hypothetical protein